MPRLSISEAAAIGTRLVEVTKEGPVTQWYERIAEIARKAGFDVSEVNWNASPRGVASDIAQHMNGYYRIDKLEQAIQEYESAKQKE